MPLSLKDLESHLFKCADIIRDAVDSTDYKEFILPLVYDKSISETFETQYAGDVVEYDLGRLIRDDDFADAVRNYRIRDDG